MLRVCFIGLTLIATNASAYVPPEDVCKVAHKVGSPEYVRCMSFLSKPEREQREIISRGERDTASRKRAELQDALTACQRGTGPCDQRRFDDLAREATESDVDAYKTDHGY
jgi:hypothetical protein